MNVSTCHTTSVHTHTHKDIGTDMYLLVLFYVLIAVMCATYLHEIRYICTLYIYVPSTPSTEPGILLMYHFMGVHPQITASLLDFLCQVNSNLLNTCSFALSCTCNITYVC